MSTELNPICRICLESEPQNKLINPCKCSGTAEYVHRNCLSRWLKSRSRRKQMKCEICNSKYVFHYNNRKEEFYSILEDKWETLKFVIFDRNSQLFALFLSFVLVLITINLYFLLLTGSLLVTIQSASLPDMDLLIWHKSDAYAIVCVDKDCDCETDILNDNNNPNWNHECLNWKNKSVSILSKVTFLVYDADHGHDDDFIGGVSLSIFQMLSNGYNNKDVILRWDKPYSGSLAIKMQWLSTPMRWWKWSKTLFGK